MLETLHTQTKKKVRKTTIFTNLKKRFKHIELAAKLLDYFLRRNKSNINQSGFTGDFTTVEMNANERTLNNSCSQSLARKRDS